MTDAISNTSPLLYLHLLDILGWLPEIFGEVWTPEAVVEELSEGQRRGYEVPQVEDYSWLMVKKVENVPSAWLALDLGAGELAAMALALENPERVVLLDDLLARRVGQAAGLKVWGTLRVLLEGKKQGLTEKVAPLLKRVEGSGLWVSESVRHRILMLAGEGE
jgi:predicted nucleic acid-binding protein